MTSPSLLPGKQELDLNANTPTEFNAMMRNILHASGRSAGQVAKLTKLPRSTAYSFANAKNTTLPKRAAQVELFVRGCGLRDEQVTRVMRTWHTLKGTAQVDEPAAAPETEVYLFQQPSGIAEQDPLDTSEAEYFQLRQRRAQLRRIHALQYELERAIHGLGAMGGSDPRVTEWRPVSETILRPRKSTKPDEPSRNVIIYNNASTKAPLVADQQASVRSWAFRRQVLVLLAMVLLPLFVRAFYGPQQTLLLHAATFGLAAVALLLLPQLGRADVVPCLDRLCIAVVVGSVAGTLAWWATGWLVVALMSGLLVFMVVPMWLAVMYRMWKGLFTCSQGLYPAILATWFGVLTGALLAATNGFSASAALGGTLTGMGVLMEAVARIRPSTGVWGPPPSVLDEPPVQ